MSRNPNLDALRALRADPANRYGYRARVLGLAYGLIRGLPLARIESDHSDPWRFPSADAILDAAMAAYRPGREDQPEAEYHDERGAFRAKLSAELTAWRKTLSLNWLTVQAVRRQRNAAKRATPRVHPRPKPAEVA